jgi:NitT/TauT family transport system permease protein
MPADTSAPPAASAVPTGPRSPAAAGRSDQDLAAQLAGLDALEAALGRGPGRAQRVWSGVWPKLAAIAIAVAAWQVLVWTHWKPEYALPGPRRVVAQLAALGGTTAFWKGVALTMRRAVIGYAVAVAVGSVVGLAVARVRPVRTAVGSLITGLMTMPSIVWLPLAILLFQLSERAIMFVVVMGAAPSIANGLISSVDHVPPLLVRAGRIAGAGGMKLYRHVVLPASLPGYVAGLKQGWAFAWRSLMAGELIVIVAGKSSIGSSIQAARDFSDAPRVIALMMVVLVIGIVVDTAFGRADRAIRRRWGLVDPAA